MVLTACVAMGRLSAAAMSVTGFLVGLVYAHRPGARDEPFRTMADAAPIMVRLAGLDHRCTYVNRGWLDFTGGRLDQELGTGWTSGVHPDDRRRVVDAYNEAVDRATPFTTEYRLRSRDGDYRWVLDSGVPWHGPRGQVAGYIDSAFDISDRKRAEETLRELGGRLIAAQEDERRRIARELHDDVSQRLALLSVELEQLHRQRTGAAAGEERWTSLSRAAAEIAVDLHRISHRLHPSRLEALGLVAAVSGFCQELWSQQRLQVRFTHEAVPRAIPSDVALCLYRVAQEALQNVIKHSGVMEAEVHLAGNGDALLLRVSDSGSGFAPDRRRDVGLGLLSMRERVASLGGDIVVQAAPGRGTRIGVRVGLQPTIGERQPA
jgi:PAS domain S-box-containing protein